MNLKKNIVASYISQLYVSVIGVLLIPLYVRNMGAEAYGLVGFFAVLQAWFNLLDIGLTPTIARETARYHAGMLNVQDYHKLLNSVTIFFICIALLGGSVGWVFSNEIASNWLNSSLLPKEQVIFSVQIMSLCIGIRLMNGPFKGAVMGAENLVKLSGYNVTIATLKYVVVIISMEIWGYTPKVFFLHQLMVGLLELYLIIFLSRKSNKLEYNSEFKGDCGEYTRLRELFAFSLGISFSSIVWAGLTQTDKFVLSGVLSLAEYGYFTLAVLFANGIILVGNPVTNSVMLRMTRLHLEKKEDEVIILYKKTTQFVMVTAGSAAIFVAIFAKQLIFVWTGDEAIANNAYEILRLYAVGNAFLVMGAFPYYLQYARGNVKYHNLGNLITLLVTIPCVVFFSFRYGAEGAGWTWVVSNFLGFVLWSAYVHSKIQPSLHIEWFLKDVIFIAVPVVFCGFLSNLIVQESVGRFYLLAQLVIASIFLLAISVISSSALRAFVYFRLLKYVR